MGAWYTLYGIFFCVYVCGKSEREDGRFWLLLHVTIPELHYHHVIINTVHPLARARTVARVVGRVRPRVVVKEVGRIRARAVARAAGKVRDGSS